MWKPGQLVTIEQQVYRITKMRDPSRGCGIICDIPEHCFNLCGNGKVPHYCYLERVTPKHI